MPGEIVMHPPPFHGRNTGFEARTAGTPSPLRWFLRLIYPNIILAKPQQITILIGHFARDADLVAMEIVGLLSVFAFCDCPIADLRQRFVGVLVGVDIGVEAVWIVFLQEVAAIPQGRPSRRRVGRGWAVRYAEQEGAPSRNQGGYRLHRSRCLYGRFYWRLWWILCWNTNR